MERVPNRSVIHDHGGYTLGSPKEIKRKLDERHLQEAKIKKQSDLIYRQRKRTMQMKELLEKLARKDLLKEDAMLKNMFNEIVQDLESNQTLALETIPTEDMTRTESNLQ